MQLIRPIIIRGKSKNIPFSITMMRFAVLFVAIVGIAVALPIPEDVPLLNRSEIRDDFNQFSLSYSGDGHVVTQQGALKAFEGDNGVHHVLVQQGKYAFVAPDGQIYEVSYIADENGFRPVVELPTHPTVPVVPSVAFLPPVISSV